MTSLNWTDTYNHTGGPSLRGHDISAFYKDNPNGPSWTQPELKARFCQYDRKHEHAHEYRHSQPDNYDLSDSHCFTHEPKG